GMFSRFLSTNLAHDLLPLKDPHQKNHFFYFWMICNVVKRFLPIRFIPCYLHKENGDENNNGNLPRKPP
ncbi:hypothetical protein AAUPMB_01130, partial [Pasteurella multocida subsp. multocida str. Anand1_buffalo]